MQDTGIQIAGWHVMLALNGVLYLMRYGTTTSSPLSSGEHPANWHEVHGHSRLSAPTVMQGVTPEEVRAILAKYP